MAPKGAERPILRGFTPVRALSRSSTQRSCSPLSSRMKECTSSMMTKRRSQNIFRQAPRLLVIRLSRDSGVICRMPSGCLISLSFLSTEASPCHLVTGILESKSICSRRLNWSLISAFRGEMYMAPTERAGFS